MSPSPVSRRRFLGTSLKLGAGAGVAALGLGATEAGAWAAPEAEGLALPAAPLTIHRFASRPDLTPPGVTVVSAPGRPSHPAYIFLAPRAVVGTGQPATSQGLMIIDLNGNLIYWRQMSIPTASAFNFRVQTYRGRPVLTWYQGTVGFSYGIAGQGVIADSTYAPIASSAAAGGLGTDLHEFLITPEDTALVTAYQSVNGGKLLISHAQEVTIASKPELVWDWPSYPVVSPALSYTGPTGDYFHINSIDLWPGSARNVLVSSRNTSAVYLVSRKTKGLLWRLGGKASSFHQGPGTAFSYQHDARPLADGSGLSLFDDASGGYTEKRSWGKVISLSGAPRATLRHEYTHPTLPFDAGSQGNLQLLPTGGHFVGWGAIPYFTLFGPSGSAVNAPVLLDGRLPPGTQNYRAFLYDWTGTPPVSEFALVVRSGGSGNFIAYASWNGATEVAHYEITGGSAGVPLKPLAGPIAKTTFEATIPFHAPGASDFQASAYNASGHLLGRTGIVGISNL
jgi:Arylsulfotransferase (ASST)